MSPRTSPLCNAALEFRETLWFARGRLTRVWRAAQQLSQGLCFGKQFSLVAPQRQRRKSLWRIGVLKQAVVAAQVDATERSGFFSLCVFKDAVAAIVQQFGNVEILVFSGFDHQEAQVEFLLQELNRRRMLHDKVSKLPQVRSSRLQDVVINKRLTEPLVSLVLANGGL